MRLHALTSLVGVCGCCFRPTLSIPLVESPAAHVPGGEGPALGPLPAIVLEDDRFTDFRRFKDVHGRERYFHGVNVVVKGPPWHPSTGSFDPDT